MNPISVDMRAFLKERDNPLHIAIGSQPEGPHDCITIYDTDAPEQNAAFSYDEGNIQLRARSKSYTKAYTMLHEAKAHIEGAKGRNIDGASYIGFWAKSGIAFLARDRQDRAEFICNFRIMRRLANGDAGNRRQ